MNVQHSSAFSAHLAHLFGTVFIFCLWIITFIIGLACVLEFGGISSRISEKWFSSNGPLPLYRTNYYGMPLKSDPYAAFAIQHLNPFYLFSLPWREADREAANNTHVNVDDSGFRINPNLAVSRNGYAILLGGSTAFGNSSSSDSHTIAAGLTAKTGIGFVNRNAPSWNSHQELVALARYSAPYTLSVAFSFSNDVSIFCDEKEDAAVTVGAPESFARLELFFNDIRGKPLAGFYDDFSLNPERVFPDTVQLSAQLKTALIGVRQKKRKGTHRGERCKDKDVTPVVEAFLHNQTAMAQLSHARGATHIVVIQPSYPLHATSNPEFWRRSDAEYDFRRRAIAQLMASTFCQEHCYDFSTLFNRLGGVSHIKENRRTFYVPRIFADDVHLTDLGVDLVTQELAKIIASVPPN